MAFNPINPSSAEGQEVNLPMKAATTITKGDALVVTAGVVLGATAAATEVRYVALETKTSAAGETPDILCLPVERVRFEVDTNTAPVQATDVGVKADLTSASVLNESAVLNGVFYIEKIVGAPANKKVQGYFVNK